MKKMEYRRPTADLILKENEDIIMTSGETCPYPKGGWVCKCDSVPPGTWCDDACDHAGLGEIHCPDWNGYGSSAEARAYGTQDWSMDLEPDLDVEKEKGWFE